MTGKPESRKAEIADEDRALADHLAQQRVRFALLVVELSADDAYFRNWTVKQWQDYVFFEAQRRWRLVPPASRCDESTAPRIGARLAEGGGDRAHRALTRSTVAPIEFETLVRANLQSWRPTAPTKLMPVA